MQAAIGQRWVFKNTNAYGYDNNLRAFFLEVVAVSPIRYRVVQLIAEQAYSVGMELPYGRSQFDPEYFTYLAGQEAPK